MFEAASIGKRLVAALVALALTLTLLPAVARAQPAPTKPTDPRAAFGLHGAPAATKPTATDPRDSFGLGHHDTDAATCATARALPCPFPTDAAPAAVITRLTRARLDRVPLADADLDTAAGLATGCGRDDSGVFYGGATGLENRWTLDGAPVDSPRTGALDSRVPLAFVDHLTIATAGLSARDRASTGAVIDAALIRGGTTHRARASLWLGATAPARIPAIAPGELRLFEARFAAPRALSAAATIDGPLPSVAGARTWYAAGLAPILADQPLLRRSYRLTDADADGALDRAPDGTYVRTALTDDVSHPSRTWSAPLLLRVGADRGAQHLDLTALATLAGDTRWLALAEDSAGGVDRRTLRLDGIATWHGGFGSLAATVQAAWHHSSTREQPHAAGGDAPAHGYAYVPAPVVGLSPTDAAVRAGCQDGGADDVAPAIANCPLPTGYYWTGGAGRLLDVASDRPSLTAEFERPLGAHRVIAGVTGDDGQLVRRERYSGGSFRQQLGDGLYLDYQQVELGRGPDYTDDCGDAGPCRILDESERVYRTRNAAAWLLDRWRPAPAVEVEVGARGEHSQLGTALIVRDILPRAGVAWDFLGGGRSRAFLGWGRYGAPLTTGTGEHLFAGPTVLQTAHFGDQQSTAVTSSPAGTQIAPGTRGVRVDEAIAGVEVGLADVARFGITARHRRLGRALEDGPTGLANPGSDPASGIPAATRDATEVIVELETSPTAATTLRTGYAWSRLVGNWPGPWDPVDGSALYFSSLFDGGDAINATGPLPGDRPHRFFAELAARHRLAGFAVDGAIRATASSGQPRSLRTAVGVQDFLLARGAGGRLPSVSQANLHLGARRGRLTITLDVFNLFDRRGVIAIDEVYAADGATPIVGGDRADLPFAKQDDDSGQPLPVNPRYGHPTRYQAPALALLGVTVEL